MAGVILALIGVGFGPASASAAPFAGVKVNFQPASAPVPSGYAADTGAGYSNAAGFGWVTQDSLSSSGHLALDLTPNTRDRNINADQRLDTFIHMQYPPSIVNATVRVPGAWEYAVPDGRYTVTVAVGEAADYFDSTDQINVEGHGLISGFAPSAAIHFATKTTTVDVSDGRLTLDAIGGTNTKLDYVDIAPAGDTTPPAAPTSVVATAGDGHVQLSWSGNTDSDLAGYNVYRSTSLPVPLATPLNAELLATPGYLDTVVSNGTTYYYVVEAVDTSGNFADAAAVSAKPASTSTDFALRVNFQSASAPVPPGYLRDSGEPYGSRTGADQGSGRTYGWVEPGTATPLSLVGNGRDRDAYSEQRYDTFVHMQYTGSNGVAKTGSWELAVPNGSYDVVATVGDSAANFDSVDQLNVEGKRLITAFVPSGSQRFSTATTTVSVTDGRLTVDANGGTNTKLDFLTVKTSHGSDATVSDLNWGTAANGPLGRHEDGSAVAGGKLYVFGGYLDTTFVPTPRAAVYDPATDAWTQIASLPEGLTHVGVAVDGNAIYVAGGYPPNSSNTGQLFATEKVWKYDINANTWTSMPSLPSARGGGALVNVNGTLHYFGGSDAGRSDVATHWALAPGGASWTAAAALPAARNHVGGVALGGKVYAVGGQQAQDAGATYSGEVDAWDPATDRWTRVKDLPSARSHISAATFTLGGRIIVVGGELSYGTSTDEVVAYDPFADVWTQLTKLPVARNSGSGGTVGGQIFYAGGGFSTTTYKGIPAGPAPPPPPPPPPGSMPELDVNFQSASAAVPSGHVRDSGEAYGPRSGPDQGNGLTYGWVSPGTSTPLSLIGNGRDRDAYPDQRYDTLLHMQYSGAIGVASPGSWETSVPNGKYSVTVGVGDSGNFFDSSHSISVEGVPLITNFVPAAGTHWQAATRVVNVADGRLTIDATGGMNTKIDFATISQITSTSPYAITATPASGATTVNRDAAVTADVKLPNAGFGIDDATMTSATVKLVRMSDNAAVSANVNTSADGDVVVLQPTQTLEANMSYRFELRGVKDLSGAALLPYTTTFTTGTATRTTTLTNVQFAQVALPTSAGGSYTTVVFGPDGKLYASTIDGLIYRFGVNADGTLGTPQVIDSLQTANGGPRMVVGLTFDPTSTAGNLIAWVSNNAFATNNAPDWSGKITRLSGPDLGTVTDYVVGLPRSIRDHLTNSIAFGPDNALYVLQGSNTAMGAADSAWGDRPEHLLNAALLRVNVAGITSPPVDVKTEAGGTYDPFAANAPLTIYASGLRNAYDMVWHSNGRLYLPTNGSSAGGNTPGTPSPLPSVCSKRIDNATSGAYVGPSVPALTNVGTQDDFLFQVVQGGYYGHPDPARCEWTLNGGNPTTSADPGEVSEYGIGTLADRNWRGFAYDFGQHFSPDGAIEYKSNVFGGALRGKLLVARYSAGDDLIALTPGGANLDITGADAGITGLTGFNDPIDLAEDPSGNGNLYLSEFGGQKLTLLRPVTGTSTARLELQNLDGVPYDDRLVFSRIGTLASPPGNAVHDRATIRLRSTGTGALTISGLQVSGPWQLVSPPTLPIRVAAGATLDLQVRFVAESGRVSTGSLTIQSDDAAGQSKIVRLAGYWQSQSENNQEPTLAEIAQVMGYQTAITSPGQTLNQEGFVRATGDEVLSPFWARVDGSQPVSVRQLASFHSCPNTATLQWFPRGNIANNIVTSSGNDCQSLLSRRSDLGGPAAGSFTPSGPFGFWVDSAESSDPTLNNASPDVTNGCPGPCGHHMRFWKVKDRNGNVVPNTWLMSMDYAGINYDYNDNVYLISNMKPAPEGQVLYRLDVGGAANYSDTSGNVWTPDTGFFTPSTARSEGGDYAIQSIDNTLDDPLFTTYRAFLGDIPVDQRVLEYNLPLGAVTRVNVRLLYAERFWTGTGKRVFNVDVEGRRVSTNLDLFKQAPGANAALTVPLYHVSVADGTLTIDFRTVADYGAINAIEVVADP